MEQLIFWANGRSAIYYVRDENGVDHDFRFENHHLSLDKDRAALLKRSNYFGKDFYQVKKRVNVPSINEIDTVSTGRVVDQSLIDEGRKRAAQIASQGHNRVLDSATTKALADAEDIELTQARERAEAKRLRVKSDAEKKQARLDAIKKHQQETQTTT